jgi:hypothetical protein
MGSDIAHLNIFEQGTFGETFAAALPPIVIKDAIIGRFAPPQELIGGPVINGANEVVGIAVAVFAGRGELIIKPWSTLEHCVEMQVVEEGQN